jgi:hypothetical protein
MLNVRKRIRTVSWGAVLLLVCSASEALADGAASPRVKLDSGQVQGAVQDTVAYFKGIPFAAPPIGNLRWRPPQPVRKWSGLRKAVVKSGKPEVAGRREERHNHGFHQQWSARRSRPLEVATGPRRELQRVQAAGRIRKTLSHRGPQTIASCT